MNDSGSAKPPSPPRLRSANLPEVVDRPHMETEPFLSGHPILPEDMEISDFSLEQLHEMNQKLLEESIGAEGPLISRPEDISVLQHEYFDLPNFVAQINTLSNQGYKTIIRVKGDGDCFYRALAFTYLRQLIHSASARRQDQLSATKTMLADAGFDKIVYEPPHDIIAKLVQSKSAAHELWSDFTDPSTSNYIVMYMRLLTSAQMHLNQDFFSGFLESDASDSVEQFCKQSVEPLGKEADDFQVTALVQALKIHVKVAYLDGHNQNGHVKFHDFGLDAGNFQDDSEPPVLLYRPGHYDILEKQASFGACG
ncbi:cysteine proteinase [Paxillus ammoniavirescens]|nr:cysteine proteinase [Paxillus ammoniavirescens]